MAVVAVPAMGSRWGWVSPEWCSACWVCWLVFSPTARQLRPSRRLLGDPTHPPAVPTCHVCFYVPCIRMSGLSDERDDRVSGMDQEDG